MGREFTSREAVLPLTYCVKEDGLQKRADKGQTPLCPRYLRISVGQLKARLCDKSGQKGLQLELGVCPSRPPLANSGKLFCFIGDEAAVALSSTLSPGNDEWAYAGTRGNSGTRGNLR